MALKTFNLDENVYKEFSKHCKTQGISMSKQVEKFIRQELIKLKRPVPTKKTKIPTEQHPLHKYV